MARSFEIESLTGALSAAVGLGSDPPRLPTTARGWKRWLALVHEHQLGALLGSRTHELERSGVALPEKVHRALYAAHVRSGQQALLRELVLQRVQVALENAGLRSAPIALKGSALAHTLYAETSEREMSDIDLLVDRSDLPAARAALIDEGFLSEGPERDHRHAPPLHDPVAEVAVELHTNLATPALPQQAVAEIASRARPHGNLRVLDPADRLLHHALHAVGDPLAAPLLRNLFEVGWMAALLRTEQRAILLERARRYAVEDPVSRALHLASRLFGTPPILRPRPEGALERWCMRRLEWLMWRDWTRSGWRRFLTYVASRHLEAIASGAAGPHDITPLIGIAAEGIGSSARSRFEAIDLGTPAQLVRVPAVTTPVGRGLLVFEPTSGRVHWLDQPCAEALGAIDGETERKALEAALSRAGLAPANARRAISALIESGLVSPKRSSRGIAGRPPARIAARGARSR